MNEHKSNLFLTCAFTALFLLTSLTNLWGQSTSSSKIPAAPEYQQWRDHLPYNTVTDVCVANGELWAATTTGVLNYQPEAKELHRYSTVNGLSEVGPTCIAADPLGHIWLGYESGLIDVFINGKTTALPYIEEASQFTGLKRINAVAFSPDFAYVATNFGIVEVDLQTLLVSRTFLLGDNNTAVAVRDLCTDPSGTLYAALSSGGVLYGDLGTNLVLSSAWEELLPAAGMAVTQLEYHRGALHLVDAGVNDDVHYRWTPAQGLESLTSGAKILALKANETEQLLAVTTPFNVYLYGAAALPEVNISAAPFVPGSFQPLCATASDNGRTFIGNRKTGIIVTENLSNNSRILPNSPYSANSYALLSFGSGRAGGEENFGGVLVCPGALDELWTRTYLSEGIGVYQQQAWTTRPTSATYGLADLIAAAYRSDGGEGELMLSFWGSGLVHLKGGADPNSMDTLAHYTTGNTDGVLRGVNGNPNDLRTGGVAFDSEGTLWGVQSLVAGPLFKRTPSGQWLTETLSPGADADALKEVLITRSDLLFVQSRTQGLFAKRLSDGLNRRLTSGVGSGDLPSNHVLSMAEDQDGELWIGTDEGLCVLYAPSNLFSGGSFDARPILFEEDGVVQRLLGSTPITALCVDGGNRKWIGTRGAGLFLVSPDGTQTLAQFTAQNSPLLSNVIVSLAIDPTSGELLVGTDKGLIGYRGDATPAGDDLYPKLVVYPNPVRPGFEGPVRIEGCPENARIKITDVRGNLVYETTANGGMARWDRTNLNGAAAASGVYLIYASDELGEISAMGKLLLVR